MAAAAQLSQQVMSMLGMAADTASIPAEAAQQIQRQQSPAKEAARAGVTQQQQHMMLQKMMSRIGQPLLLRWQPRQPPMLPLLLRGSRV
jgi:hypothetical protein